jgi:hypothetical protein
LQEGGLRRHWHRDARWGITALDFDNVENDDVVLRLLPPDTYVERSPSGRGLQAFQWGSLGNSKGKFVETFDTTGFVTVTGDVLPGLDLVGDPGITEPTAELLEVIAGQGGRRGVAVAMSDRVPLGFTLDQVREALGALDPSCGYDDWIKAGMAVHHETDGSDDGFELWHEWSSKGFNYASEEDCAQHWAFGSRVKVRRFRACCDHCNRRELRRRGMPNYVARILR